MRWLTAWGVAIALCGCNSPRPREGVRPDVTNRVAVGQSLAEAHARLQTSGAKDISGTVGIIAYPPDRLRWYELRDGTCLCVRAVAEDGGEGTIQGLELGEPGRGYGDKIKWLGQQHREVTAVEL